MNVRDQLYAVALERGLRQSTVRSYETLLGRIGLLDATNPDVSTVLDAIWKIENPNSRRAAVIAVRAVTSLKIKIPKAIPRRYDLPEEDTLRLALMLTPHQTRGLLMMYAGLRVGEACAITAKDRSADRLLVDKQVVELYGPGEPVLRIGPTKTYEASIVIPHWLGTHIDQLEETVRPGAVRESLRRAGFKVGIKLNPHMLRHWYATTLLDRGVPVALVSKQMRHSDVAVTLRTYSQFTDGDIHKAIG